MTHVDITSVIQIAVSILAFAAGYGSIHARLKAVEQSLEDTVSRREHESLERRLLEIVQELRGLRAEIIASIYRRPDRE